MENTNEPKTLFVSLREPLSGDWDKDKLIIARVAGQATPADEYYNHAASIQALFEMLTYGTRSQPEYPQRIGLLRDVHDELYPIAHFAKLYFKSPSNVVIQWVEGNQHHDAIVKYIGDGSNQSDIHYLEVTTLQGKEDADELSELSKSPNGIVQFRDSDQEKHDRKIEQLKAVLEKKRKIRYPEKTALLVYTDEMRFCEFYFGVSPLQIDRKADFEAVLRDFAPSVTNFSHIFIFSKKEIYCTWTPDSKLYNC